LTKSQTFKPVWPELGLIIAELGLNVEKTWFSRVVSGITVSLYNYYYLFVVWIWKFAQKSNF